MDLSPRTARASRRRLSANLPVQKAALLDGMLDFEQLVWRCQKQPLTKTAHFRDRLAKSGRPGKPRTFSR